MKLSASHKLLGRLRNIVSCFVLIPALFSVAAHAQISLPTHHVRQAILSGKASFVGLLPGTLRLNIAIMLPVRDQAGLDAFLKDLYDPRSPQYHQYLTVGEFADRFGPSPGDYDAVVQFAQSNGMTVTTTPSNRMLVDINARVSDINRAFHLALGVYQHPTENRTFFAPDREPSVDLTVPLWHIAGLDNFSTPRPLYLKGQRQGYSNTSGSGPSGNFLGSDRRAAYYGGTALTGAGQSLGLVEFDGYSTADVQQYFNNVGQPLSVPINNIAVDGANTASDGDDTEQVIDIIDAISMAPGLSQVRVYIAPLSSIVPVQSGPGVSDMFNQMATDDVKQISCSWTWTPADITEEDGIFQEFAAQGQTFFSASGDNGSYNASQPYHYPEEDAWVTAVGGTILGTSGAGGYWQSEIAWGGSNTSCVSPGTGSGGGPSPDGVPIPNYQQIAGVINPQNQGSTTLRNVPDVAAEANCDNYYCANGKCGTGLGGTSLAAPTWAGFIALVNEQNVANGKSTAGFINPTVYSAPIPDYYFNDVTAGDNYNTYNPNLYPAVYGYDLATGWGTPTPIVWLGYIPSGACSPSLSCLDPEYDYLTASITLACQGGVGISLSAQACFYGAGCNQSTNNETTNGFPSNLSVNSPYGVGGGAESCSFTWKYGEFGGSGSLQPGQSGIQ